MSDKDWWKKGVFYQIYPRSYLDRSGDGVGDLIGITDRLEYVARLGIDGIWISPFFLSPMADFGYDVSDYRIVDPIFGTNEDFDILLKKAHGLGLRIIVDMVLSHTSIEHAWFKESRLGSDNRKSDWYVWADAKPDGSPPNNWQSVFGGAAWTFDTKRGQYYMHNFLKEQPDLNFHNPAVQKQMLSECEFWLERGVDGFRLDTVNFYFHDEDLRDNPPRDPDMISTGVQVEQPYPYTMQRHIHDKSQPENIQFLADLRKLMDRYGATMTIGEIGDDDPYKLATEYTDGEKLLHTTYNTHLLVGTGEGNVTRDTIEIPFKDFAKYPGNGWPSWAFSNHDVVRSVTRWGKGIKDKDSFAVLLNKLLLSLRGTPFLYQGEELGLPEATIPYEKLQDPWGIFMWPEWQGRDGCRTPMPWNKDKPNIGFSKKNDPQKELWLPIPYEHAQLAVRTQEDDENSILNQTTEFIHWRKTQPLLQTGDMEFLDTKNDKLIAFKRFDENSAMTCLFNLSEESISFDGKEIKGLEAVYEEG